MEAATLGKFVAVLLIASVSVAQVRPALARAPVAPPAEPAPPRSDVNECIQRGRNDGLRSPTGGAFAIGFASGFFYPVIGNVIAYTAQGEPKAPALTKQQIADATCQMAYADAFGEAGKKKKRSAALHGGLLGTATLLVLIVAAVGIDAGGSY